MNNKNNVKQILSIHKHNNLPIAANNKDVVNEDYCDNILNTNELRKGE